MFCFQVYRKLFLAASVVALSAMAGCKGQATDEATSQPANQSAPRQQAKASPAPAKPAAAKPVAAKPAAVSASKPAANKNAAPKAVAVAAKSTQPAQLVNVTVPKGTPITATVGQSLASNKNHTGDSFAASLSAPIEVDGKVVLPKGAHVTGRIVAIKKHELRVTLASVVVHGKSYSLATNSVRPADRDPRKNDSSDAKADASSSQKQKKENSTLSAKTQLTFKLAKPITVSVKG